jgi:hypothetical protein
MALKKKERKPDKNQNSKQMTLSTKFNFKFATLQKYSSKKTTLNITLIREDQRKRRIKGNTRILQFNIKQHFENR